MTGPGTTWLADLTTALDWLLPIPSRALIATVNRRGDCLQEVHDEEPPAWLSEPSTDRELAARMCGNCPVPGECLELELRTYGAETVGVWGGLAQDDRRALFPLWLDRSEREGGDDR